MQAYEASLLRNKFDHLAFSPKVLSDKDRTDNIKMFLINSSLSVELEGLKTGS